jgi:ABC-2 type transport system ATP-binding protein
MQPTTATNNIPFIQCTNVTYLTKRGKVGIADLSLEVYPGEVFGIVGPSGSGKSLLARLIAGQIIPNNGQLTVGGIKIHANRQKITTFLNYLAQEPEEPDYFTVQDLLLFTGQMRGMPDREARNAVRDLLERAQLTKLARRPMRTLTSAQQQLVRCCVTLMGYPYLLVLDDPTRHFDLGQRLWFWNLLEGLHQQTSLTIVITSPNIADLERHASRVAFLQNGQIIALGTPADLIMQFGAGPRMDVKLVPGTKLTAEMQRRLSALGTLQEKEANTITLHPRPDVIGSLGRSIPAPQRQPAPQPTPKPVPTKTSNRAQKTKTQPAQSAGTPDDSWLLDSPSVPGSLGRAVEEIFAIIGRERITEFWFAPPTLEDVYFRLEGGFTHG